MFFDCVESVIKIRRRRFVLLKQVLGRTFEHGSDINQQVNSHPCHAPFETRDVLICRAQESCQILLRQATRFTVLAKSLPHMGYSPSTC